MSAISAKRYEEVFSSLLQEKNVRSLMASYVEQNGDRQNLTVAIIVTKHELKC